MAIVHDASAGKSLAARLLTTDFCPWANRFVYWLKEPVGWFVLATAACVIVGLYFAPIGWTLAAALASMIAVGMAWPAIAVRAVVCSIRSGTPHVHEDQNCELQLEVRNRLPIPVWGLAVEGFLDRQIDDAEQPAVGPNIPTVALAFVRILSTATYRFSIRPRLRGRYPDGNTILTCSFPFGIWTAKRKLNLIEPVTVWPKVFAIAGQSPMSGRQSSGAGEGNRPGLTGDFQGLRDYREGDCLRQVNWTATARHGDLVVTERSVPQCPFLSVVVDATIGANTKDSFVSRDALSDRIRVAASLLANLHCSDIPVRLRIGQDCFNVRRGTDGFVQMMDALANVPERGRRGEDLNDQSRDGAGIVISSTGQGNVSICVADPSVNHRLVGHVDREINRDQDLGVQLHSFWAEVRDANLVA